MDDLLQKFQELPDNAQYVIMGAGGLIGLLLIILIFVAILSATGSSEQTDNPRKIKVPKRLPIAPILLMNDRESALHEVLITALSEIPGYDVHAKVSTTAVLGPREDEHPKVAAAIEKKIVKDFHDFVIVDRNRFPVAVIELDSEGNDEREEQARRAGLPIIRVRNPHVDPDDMAERLRKIIL
jgi:hypothetical protein